MGERPARLDREPPTALDQLSRCVLARGIAGGPPVPRTRATADLLRAETTERCVPLTEL